jgi:hypothetical protein
MPKQNLARAGAIYSGYGPFREHADYLGLYIRQVKLFPYDFLLWDRW